MKTYSRLTLAFLLLLLVVPQVGADDPPENGPYVEYRGGTKWRQTDYEDGKKTLVTEWYRNGQKYSEQHYKNGKKDGLWNEWYDNGQKWSEVHYNDEGKKAGLEAEWHKNGQKAKEAHYKNGKRDGLWTEWSMTGRKRKETHYKNGKRDGVDTWWHGTGHKGHEYHWKDDKKDGPCIEYITPNSEIEVGSEKKSAVQHYKNGEQHGLEIKWMYSRGHRKHWKVKEAHYKDGIEVGLTTRWRPYLDNNGVAQKKSEVHCNDEGKKDGPDLWWYRNGQMGFEGHYKNGKKDGLWIEWDEDGKKRKEEHWKNGTFVSRKEF